MELSGSELFRLQIIGRIMQIFLTDKKLQFDTDMSGHKAGCEVSFIDRVELSLILRSKKLRHSLRFLIKLCT